MTQGAVGGRQRSLGARAGSGAAWTILSHGGVQGLRFVGNLILTRLLFEEAFGIMALVSVFLIGLTLFSDIGIGPSIIQNERGEEPRFLNTAWTIQVGRGTILWLVSCAGAAPFAEIYGHPELATILPVSGLTALILGFESTKLFTANRHLLVGRLAAIEIASQAAGLASMVAWALVDRSVWALVSAGIVSAVVKVVLSHVALPGIRNRLLLDRDDARSLLRFGRWIFVSTAVTFLAQQSDRLIFGRLIPLGLLGIYQIGFTLASMPTVAVSQLSARVIFPLFSRLRDAGQELASAFVQVRTLVFVVAGWALSGLIAGGSTVTDILYDERYLQAGWIVQLTAVGCWFAVSGDTYGAVLLSTGNPKWLAAANSAKFFGLVGFIPLGNLLAGFPGAVAGIVLAEIFRLVVLSAASARLGVLDWRQDLSYGAWVAVGSLAGWLADAGLAQVGAHVAVRAVAVFVAVTLAWLPAGLKGRRRLGLLRATLGGRADRDAEPEAAAAGGA